MLFHHTIEDYWTIICQHFKDCLVKIVRVFAPDTFGPKSLCQFHEIWQRLRPAVRIPLAVQQLLPLADHAEAFIVHNKLLYRQPELHSGSHLLHIHQPAGLAGDIDHQRVAMRHLHPNRGRRSISHGAQAARCHPLIGGVKADVLRGPHLMLADLCTNEAVLAVLGQRLQTRQCVLRFDDFAALFIGQAILFFPVFDLSPPVFNRTSVNLASARFPDLQYVF